MGFQKTRVIVDVHREQARSYNGVTCPAHGSRGGGAGWAPGFPKRMRYVFV